MSLKGYIEDELAKAFGEDFEGRSKYAAAMATAIKTYLRDDVQVKPGQSTAGGPSSQKTVSPGSLIAP